MNELQTLESLKIPGLLPEHWRENAPGLITFVQRYYEWMYRHEGMDLAEVGILQVDDSWPTIDLDKYQKTGRLRYLMEAGGSNLMEAIVQESNTRAPGAELASLADDAELGHEFDTFITADGDVFEDADGLVEDSKNQNPSILRMYIDLYGGMPIQNVANLRGFDPVLLTRLLKHIYDIKGTYKCTELFFEIFFGEKVEIKTPKFSIAIIDGGFTPDDINSVIRDDHYYQEFSYVIVTEQDPAVYADLFNTIYKQYLHPAGFQCFIEKRAA